MFRLDTYAGDLGEGGWSRIQLLENPNHKEINHLLDWIIYISLILGKNTNFLCWNYPLYIKLYTIVTVN